MLAPSEGGFPGHDVGEEDNLGRNQIVLSELIFLVYC